ncbi:outer membrane protein assembly factor BamE [Motilimonas cestriensis]|uniref:Outer membrane protein assembly factor BamE n=1 Tax=Motilimonas cestriensis TaxID=2742685 RepID=A0ABS8W6N9_9GAMM|nr:outer membrane protein assembly factor BamE [Motilimonas cestriensis]MCE2593757.1 outer membrane protein assembly factor BamE [Motilimonas cestriensis]
MRLKSLIAAAAFSLSLSGCSAIYDKIVFQIDVAQGNFVEAEQIDKLSLGMTKEQVSYVMGSPMLIDTFDSNKWYYLYYFKPGGEKSEQSQMELVFGNDKLIRVSGDPALTDKFSDQQLN